MNSLTLRQFWSLIEENYNHAFLSLSDTELVKQLIRQLDDKYPLSSEENTNMNSYISSRTLLIREMIEASLA